VTLEILDAQGEVVRRYSSTDRPEQPPEELDKELIPLYWLRPQRILPADAGMHRWVWDLRYSAPSTTAHEYPIAAVPHDTPKYPLGPLVPPGKFSVRLIADGRTLSAGLMVKMDPRVKASAADLQQQFNLEMDLVSGVSQSSEAVTQARSIREQIAKLTNAGSSPLKEQLGALDNKVSELLDRVKKPAAGGDKEPSLTDTNGNLLELYKQVEQADAAPTQAQVEASTKTETGLTSMLTHWNDMKNKDIPVVNEQLKSGGLPALRLDLPPQQQAGGEDEE
jgi:hypothetical protein